MKKSRFTSDHIAFALKQAEPGTPIEEVCRKLGVSQQTFYRWKKKTGGLNRLLPISAWTNRSYRMYCQSLLAFEKRWMAHRNAIETVNDEPANWCSLVARLTVTNRPRMSSGCTMDRNCTMRSSVTSTRATKRATIRPAKSSWLSWQRNVCGTAIVVCTSFFNEKAGTPNACIVGTTKKT